MTDYKRNPIRPLEALKGIRALIADKEDTTQVFRIVRALSGNSGYKAFKRFEATSIGARVLAQKEDVCDLLADREGLAAMPEGSAGRAYLDFMVRENISLEGLREMGQSEYEKQKLPENMMRFYDRSRDLHDLYHVITGYGRDGFGEVCVLSFTNAQSFNPGIAFIIWVGKNRLQREFPGFPVKAAVKQAAQMGKNSPWFIAQDWNELLRLPLIEVRQRLNICVPTLYKDSDKVIESTGVLQMA